jgi:hypothetical protein
LGLHSFLSPVKDAPAREDAGNAFLTISLFKAKSGQTQQRYKASEHHLRVGWRPAFMLLLVAP